MIQIEKRIITVDKMQMIQALQELSNLYRRIGYIGFDLKTINKEFKLKLTFGDFANLCKQLDLEMWKATLRFDEINTKYFA